MSSTPIDYSALPTITAEQLAVANGTDSSNLWVALYVPKEGMLLLKNLQTC